MHTQRNSMKPYQKRHFLTVAIILEDNIELRSRLQNKALPTKEYITITADDGHRKYQEFTFVKIVSLPVYNVYNMRERTVLFPRPAKQRHSWKLLFLVSAILVQLLLPPVLNKIHITQYPLLVQT